MYSSYYSTMVTKSLKSMIRKSKKVLNGKKSSQTSNSKQQLKHNINGTASTESTASILEAIQTRMLEEEEMGWNDMELDLEEEEPQSAKAEASSK